MVPIQMLCLKMMIVWGMLNKTENKFFIDGNYHKVTVSQILEMKKRNEKAAFVTAYDYSNALICDKAGVDGVLVGDSEQWSCSDIMIRPG